MSFQELMRHDVIGWDFDNTLVGNANSKKIQAFIRSTPEKRHFIVTFRTHGWEKEVWEELQSYPASLSQEDFVGLLNIEDERQEHYALVQQTKNTKRLILPDDDFEDEDVHPAELYYLEWKGRICSEYGITVLVDDMAHIVKDGCEKYGVTFINTFHL